MVVGTVGGEVLEAVDDTMDRLADWKSRIHASSAVDMRKGPKRTGRGGGTHEPGVPPWEEEVG